jgi:ATP-dependent DNA helicase PIF1
MVHRHAFEAMDRSLRDLMRPMNPKAEQLPFGGKVVVFGGDFRQILPVIPKGDREDIVGACLSRSLLWRYARVYRLNINMHRVCQLDSANRKWNSAHFATTT